MKLEWTNFENVLGDWARLFKPFFDNGGFEPIFEFLKHEGRRGKKIAPLSENLFRCFQETKYSELKVVVAGYCPYHTFKNNKPVADGLALSCSITNQLQPSLEQWYNAIENEFNVYVNREPNLSYLSKEGILLYNTALTTEKDKPGSHKNIWKEFSKYFFEEVISMTGVPIIFLGKDAIYYSRYLAPMQWKFEISHPASAAYKNEIWSSEGAFKKCSSVVKDMNNMNIKWYEEREFDLF